jgi:hypothetical protein
MLLVALFTLQTEGLPEASRGVESAKSPECGPRNHQVTSNEVAEITMIVRTPWHPHRNKMKVVGTPPSRLKSSPTEAIRNYMEMKSKAVKNPMTLPPKQSAAFSSLDVGSPQLPGSARQVGGGWDLTAGGVDIWEKSDQFHFLNKQISGDFDIAVRVESFSPAHLYSKAGLMIRETLNPDSPHLMFLVFSDNSPRNNNLGGYELQFRSEAGGDCHAIYPAKRPPAPPEFPAAFPNSWLRVERRGDRFSAFASTDGKNWKLYATQTLALATRVYVGPALTSHEPQVVATARFCNYAESK